VPPFACPLFQLYTFGFASVRNIQAHSAVFVDQWRVRAGSGRGARCNRPSAGGGIQRPFVILVHGYRGAGDVQWQPEIARVGQVAGIPTVAHVEVGGPARSSNGQYPGVLRTVRIRAWGGEVRQRAPRAGGGACGRVLIIVRRPAAQMRCEDVVVAPIVDHGWALHAGQFRDLAAHGLIVGGQQFNTQSYAVVGSEQIRIAIRILKGANVETWVAERLRKSIRANLNRDRRKPPT
jgi:hypothetical protein